MRLTIALGGNAILKPGQKGTAAEQLANVYQSCQQIGELAAAGHEIVITHGNGPQVGNILIQQAAAKIPALPLDFCGAQTQGLIGYMIQNSLLNVFKDKKINIHSSSVVTQVLVDENDPAFEQPSKPVGPFFDREHAQKQEKEKGEKWMEDSGRGWRRVVPSPQPLKIMEKDLINDLIENKRIVIAAGGGGIPVVEKENKLKGVEAVIDKDRAGCILAQNTASDFFLILTDVDNVMINYGTAEEKALKEVSISEIEKHLAEGQFGQGSMAPKVESAVKFVKEGGKKAVITSLNKVRKAVKGQAGTIITSE